MHRVLDSAAKYANKKTGFGMTRDVAAVYLQTASASAPIASAFTAFKKITEILLVKYDQCVGSR